MGAMREVETHWAVGSPAPPLTPYVERYVGYRLAGFPPGLHRGMPSRHMTFIVGIGGDIDVAVRTDPRQAPHRYRSVVSGLQASPALVAHDGTQEGVAIELTPMGARALFGMPARALWNTTVELEDLAGPAGAELWERLQSIDGWAARFSTCDDVLGRIVRSDRAEPTLDAAWQTLVAGGGRAPVEAIADRVGWSRQHLARRFGEEFGLTPRLASRIVRFERACEQLRTGAPIADAAAACGYFDQSHLNRDFRVLAGCSPTRWLREELPSFQDDDGRVRQD